MTHTRWDLITQNDRLGHSTIKLDISIVNRNRSWKATGVLPSFIFFTHALSLDTVIQKPRREIFLSLFHIQNLTRTEAQKWRSLSCCRRPIHTWWCFPSLLRTDPLQNATESILLLWSVDDISSPIAIFVNGRARLLVGTGVPLYSTESY